MYVADSIVNKFFLSLLCISTKFHNVHEWMNKQKCFIRRKLYNSELDLCLKVHVCDELSHYGKSKLHVLGLIIWLGFFFLSGIENNWGFLEVFWGHWLKFSYHKLTNLILLLLASVSNTVYLNGKTLKQLQIRGLHVPENQWKETSVIGFLF